MFKVISKFRGIKAYEEELAKEEAMTVKGEDVSRPPKRKSQEIDPKLRQKSNEKRLKSLEQKLESDRRQQSVVKDAISSGLRLNKRIVFQDNDIDQQIDDFPDSKRPESDVDSAKTQKKVKQLFESDSEEDNIDGNDKKESEDIDFNKKINNKNAEKLIELSSRFAHDSRFKIDERFLDQPSDDNEEDVTEKDRALIILEEVLGKKLKESDKKTNKKAKELFVSRFDPKSDKSSALEVNSEKKFNKKVSFDPKIIEKEQKKKAEEEVSKEVYYEVGSALKDSLAQKEEEFSLTKLFGTSEEVSESSFNQKNEEPIHEKLNKQSKRHKTRNPFKYDSSSEEESDDDNEEQEEDSDEEAIKSRDKRITEFKPVLNPFKFFFDKNDSRFSEDVFWDKELVQKARNETKERKIMIVRAMSVRKRSAKKNIKSEHKYQRKFKNPHFRRFNKQNTNKKFDND